MKLLAIDTSGPVCGVAVMKDGAIVYEASAINKMTHSVNLLPMIDAALHSAGVQEDDLDRIPVVRAHAHNTPCVAVDALEAMAAGAGAFSGVICPIQDARAGQVYGAAFSAGEGRPERLMDDIPLKLEEYVATIQSFGDRFLFLGDGMPVHKAKLETLLGDTAVFAQPQLAFLRPASVAYLAALAEDTVDYLALEPLYLRAPNAALNKKLTEGLKNGK